MAKKLFRKIDISSVSGIDKAIAFLEKNLTQEALQEKVDKVATALIDEGQKVAKAEYPAVVQVDVDHQKGEHTLTATDKRDGDGIAFIEFGAGLTTDGSGEFAKRAPFNVEEGSYSVAKDPPGQYAQTGFRYWEFNGERMNAVMPRPGMEMARRHIEDNAEKKLKEVFGVD